MSDDEQPLEPEGHNNAAFSNFHSSAQAFEGSGIFSDAASTVSDIRSGNWGGVAADAVGDGLDALGVAMDPLGSLIGAGIGWLIEHISFLKKPLDLLAGDPDAVTEKAQTWTNIASQLTKTASDYQDSADALKPVYSGVAADGYATAAQNYSATVQGAATHAQSAAHAMTIAATVVGTTRGVIRDSLSQFAGDAIVKFAAAAALTPITFGASDAAFIADEVAEGTSLGAKFASKMSDVASTLDKLAKGGSDSAKVLEDTTKSMSRDLGKGVEDAGKSATKGVGNATKDATEGTEDAAKSTTKMAEYNKKADELNTKVAHHNTQVKAKQQQIASLQKRIDEETDPVKRAHLSNYLGTTIKPKAEELDAAGKKLAKEQGEVAKTRAEAWKAGAQERTFGRIPGLSEDGTLGQAHEYLENHQVVDKTLEGTVEAGKQTESDQPLRSKELNEESERDLDHYDEENPGFSGSLVESTEG
jgi:hypothetical protein